MADADGVARADRLWRPDPTAGSLSGAQFHWSAILRFWPERHVLRATLDGLTLALMQVDDEHVALRERPPALRAVYVSFLEVAPYIRMGSWERRFTGLGPAMLTFAVARSRQLGYQGRVGLHSIIQAREFYEKIGFREVPDPGLNEYWEAYMELQPEAVDNFIRGAAGVRA